jgi:hypothetical protein
MEDEQDWERPAFPNTKGCEDGGLSVYGYYVGKALQGMLSSAYRLELTEEHLRKIVEDAELIADIATEE